MILIQAIAAIANAWLMATPGISHTVPTIAFLVLVAGMIFRIFTTKK